MSNKEEDFMKKMFVMLGLGCILMIGNVSVSAEELSSKVQASLVDDNSGEKTELQVKSDLIKNEINSARGIMNNDEHNVGYLEVFAPIEVERRITARDSSGFGKTGSGVIARVDVYYDKNGKGDKIKVTGLAGSWMPTSHIFTVSKREVGLHSGITTSTNLLNRFPTSNAFWYSTNWGFVNLVGGQNSPRVWTEATVTAHEMPGPVRIVVESTFGWQLEQVE